MKKTTKGLIMAAGIGSRIRPMSNQIPKPLIKVNGTPMIESIIEAMISNDITNIYIVLGYLKEKFYYLEDKYEEVNFLINKDYESRGAISSFYAARNILIDDFVISEGNFYVTDENVYNTDLNKTTYVMKEMQDQKEFWGFDLINNNTRINKIINPKVEGSLNNRLYGIAFWKKADLVKLNNLVVKEYNNTKYLDSYHEEVLNTIIDELHIEVRTIKHNQLYEINQLSDLVEIDKQYLSILKQEEASKFKKVVELAEVLSLNSAQLVGVYEAPGRSTNNKNYVIETEDEKYFLRIAGEGTDLFSDREIEKNAYKELKESDIVDEVYFIDADSGIKISKFYENSRVLNINSEEQLVAFIEKLKLIHTGNYDFIKHDNVFDRMLRYEKYVLDAGGAKHFQPGVKDIIKTMYSYKEELADEMLSIPIHGDCSPNNTIVLEDGTVKLIDLEFIQMGDPYTDLANFAHDGEMNPRQLLHLLELYIGDEPSRKQIYKLYILAATISIMWYSWAAYKMTVEPQDLYKFKEYRDGYYNWYKLMHAEALKYK